MPSLRMRALIRLTAGAITAFARAMTAVQAVWGCDPAGLSPRVYFANHASHGDFILIWTVLGARARGRTRPVAGAEYWQGSRLKRFIGGAVFRALLVAREGGTGGDPIGDMAQVLGAGESLILFPEGTRNRSDAPLLPFKSGIYRLFERCPEAEFVPVWIDNLNRVLPKGAIIPVPLMCKVSFGAPLSRIAGEPKEAFLARAQAAVLALAPEGV